MEVMNYCFESVVGLRVENEMLEVVLRGRIDWPCSWPCSG